tara:strand:+ start:296 stop:514 length:219 start_codon:yes stop_codon:yes gene_type:complete
MAKGIIRFQYEVEPEIYEGNVASIVEQPVGKRISIEIDGNVEFDQLCSEMTSFLRVVGFDIGDLELAEIEYS